MVLAFVEVTNFAPYAPYAPQSFQPNFFILTKVELAPQSFQLWGFDYQFLTDVCLLQSKN